MSIVQFLIVLYLLTFNNCVENLEVIPTTDDNLTVFENHLLRIFQMYNLRTIIAIYHRNSLFEKYSGVLFKIGRPVFNINLRKLPDFNRNYKKGIVIEESKLNVIFIENLQEFPRILKLSRQIHFWKDRDKVIIIVDDYQDNDYQLLQDSFEDCFKFYIINVVFLIPNYKSYGFSYNPFLKDYSIIVDNTEPFPDKVRNLYGYQLKVSMFNNVMDAAFDGVNYIGRDGTTSRTILQHLNATYIYHQTVETATLPLVDVQLYEVANRTVDLGFNTRYVKRMFQNLVEGTYPHDSDDLVALVPVVYGTSHPSLISCLPLIGWLETLTGAILFIISVVILAKVNKQEFNFFDIVITALIVLLGIGVKEMKITKYRLALYFYIFFCFIVNTLTLSKLTSVLTAPPRFEQINTVEQLAATNYQILTLSRYKVMLNELLPQNQRKRILPRVAVVEERDQIDEISKCNGVVHICKHHVAQYSLVQKTNYPNQKRYYREMKEAIMPSINCYIVTFGSPFLPRLNLLIRRIIESGLMDQWKHANWHRLFLKLGVVVIDSGNAKSLSLSSLKSAFYPLLCGLLLSLLVFFGEIIKAGKFIKLRRTKTIKNRV